MSDAPKPTASPLYALGRLVQALDAAVAHADPAVRKRAAARAGQWRAVLSGMSGGTLAIGSRTPVADTPAWVTLEVAHGGFATGRYLAEGPLMPDEEARLPALTDVPGDTARARLNGWFLGDAGQAALVDAVREGRLTIGLPEDGALPVVAWLLERGQVAEALDLVATLRPLMHRLRFYPRLEATPRPAGSVVRVAASGEVAAALRAAPARPQIAAMHEALRVWNPLYDRLVALWLTTVDGEAPHLASPPGAGPRALAGGWPGARWPDDWSARRDAWLADYRAAAAAHPRCRKHRDPRSNLCRLREALERCTGEQAASRGDLARVRQALAGTLTRTGAPGSPTREALRATQAKIAARPGHTEVAGVLARRLGAYPATEGLPTLDPIAVPIAEGECLGVPAGTAIPPHMLAKVRRALEAPIADLVEHGVIASSEVLAIVLPQITAQIAAAGIAEPGLRDLYSQIYAAFRRRRSLLLLDLEHQVRFEELPWIAALAPLRRDDQDTVSQARQALEEVTILALTGFPATILPNPLVRELDALAKRAGLELPLCQEIAADIFMGTFTTKWVEAAAITSESLADTLYARYYDLPSARSYLPAKDDEAALRRVTADRPAKRRAKPTADTFAALCTERAREAGTTGGGRVAINGAILEQSQILTTHNLAALIRVQGLGDRVRLLAPALVTRALRFVVRRQAQTPPTFKARLQAVKNAAYAWRQAIFLLSFCDPVAQRRALAELQAEVAAAPDRGWAERFQPAVAGLRLVLDGGRFDTDGHGPGPELAVRFLGWSVGKHWLFP